MGFRRFYSCVVAVSVCGLALLTVACGGGGGGDTGGGGVGGGTGTTAIFIQDQPLDELVEFEIDLTGVVFNPGNVSVLPQPVRLELTSLQLKRELVRLGQVATGSYTSVQLTFANAEVKFNNTGTGSIDEVNPPISPASVTVNASFTVSTSQLTGLLIDFDLLNSVVTDASGNITSINPMVTVSVLSVAGLVDEFEDEVGRVVSVNSGNQTFVFEPFSSCVQVTVQVTGATELEDFPTDSFSDLMAGQIVEVDADLQADGTIVAEEVELEDDDMEDEAEGLIVSVTRDPLSDEVTQFVMVPFDAAPCSATLGNLDTITVTVPSGVDFRIDDDGLPVNNSQFDDRTDLDVGQKVDVDPTGALSGNITAEEIKLEDQTIRGTVISTSGNNFFFDPASDLFPDQNIEVVTFPGITEFDNPPGSVGGLSGGDDVRVRGLLFRIADGVHQMAAKRVRED